MATTSILALLVALSALAIYSNADQQVPGGQAYPQGGQYSGNGAAPQGVGPYKGYSPPPYSGYSPQYPGYQQPPQYPGYSYQYPQYPGYSYQYPQYPGYSYQYPGYSYQYPQYPGYSYQYPQYPGYSQSQNPQDSGYNQYYNPDKNTDPLTVAQNGTGESHGSYNEVNLTNKNKTTEQQIVRTGVFGINVAKWDYQNTFETQGGSKHKKSIETW
ncbi:hypothetical protein KQX54_003541 [Cotesia glomerata]|uniref:Uncharacterized protein n=1 Tax=Cotesia glomerata TaxID=32391 RepID=A0AAV7HQQ3_COTGL|nr:hypothetical protein KQX54_003541 [Cotesia glomerata]